MLPFHRILGFGVIVLLTVTEGSHAEPYMAVLTGKQCSACHVNVNGQGMRNSFGVQYAEEFLSITDTADSMPLIRKASQELSIGVDFRLQNFTSMRRDRIINFNGLGETSVVQPPGEVTANSFLLEQANLYANITLVPDRVSFYISEEIAQEPTRNRELTGIISFPEHSAYMKVGKMYMPYGLRIQDRDSFLMAKTGVLDSDFGIEMGVEKGPFSLIGSVQNAHTSLNRFDNAAKQYTGKLTVASKYFWGGGSVNYNVKGQTMAAGFIGLHFSRMAILHETNVIHWDRPFLTYSGTETVSYVSANVGLTEKGTCNLKVSYEYHNPNGVPGRSATEAYTGSQSRFRIGVEPFITPFVQARLFYSHNSPDDFQIDPNVVHYRLGNNNTLMFELHVFL